MSISARRDLAEQRAQPREAGVVKGVSVPPSAMVQALLGQGASAELAESFGEMVGGINSGAITFHGTPIRGAITLEQRLRSLLAPAR